MSFPVPQAPNAPGQNNIASPKSNVDLSSGQEFREALNTISNIIVEGDAALQESANQALPNQTGQNDQQYSLYQQINKSNTKSPTTQAMQPDTAAASLYQSLAQNIVQETSKKMSEKLIVTDNEGQQVMPSLTQGAESFAAAAAGALKAEKEQQNNFENEFLHNPLQQVEGDSDTQAESVGEETSTTESSSNQNEATSNIAMPSVQVQLESSNSNVGPYQGAAKFHSKQSVSGQGAVLSEDVRLISQAGYTAVPFLPLAEGEEAVVEGPDAETVQSVQANLSAQVLQHQNHLLALRSDLDRLLTETLNSISVAPSSEADTVDAQANLFTKENLETSSTEIQNMQAQTSSLIVELNQLAATGIDSNAEFRQYQEMSAKLQRLEIQLSRYLNKELSSLYINPFKDAQGNVYTAAQVDALPVAERADVIARQKAEDAALVIDGNESLIAPVYQALNRTLIDISTMNDEINGVAFIPTDFPTLPSIETERDASSFFSGSVVKPSYESSNVDIYTKAEEETGEFFDAIAQFVAAFNNPDPNADKSLTLRDGTYIRDVTDLTGLTVFGHWIKLAQSLLEIVTGVYNYLVNAEKKLHSASQN